MQTDVVGGTVDIVGKGLDTVGLTPVREAILGDDEMQERERRRAAGLPGE